MSAQNHQSLADPSPQRWLEPGEVLRTTAFDPKKGLRGERVLVSTYVVPATLRLLGTEAEDIARENALREREAQRGFGETDRPRRRPR